MGVWGVFLGGVGIGFAWILGGDCAWDCDGMFR